METLPFNPSTITRNGLKGAGMGLFGTVVHIKGTNFAVKEFPPLEERQHSERKIYEHLRAQSRQHPNVLKYYGKVPPEYELFKGGLVFEYHSRGTLLDSLGKWDAIGITKAQRSCWPYQAASAVAYIHSFGVIHCDLGIHNFLIHDDGSLVLCDFAGSAMPGLKNTVAPSERYSSPFTRELDHEFVPEDDVFALGTVLYEIYFEQRLFEGENDGQIRRNIREGKFPDLSLVPLSLRNVIKKCWSCRGYKASEAMAELEPPKSLKWLLLGLEITTLVFILAATSVTWGSF